MNAAIAERLRDLLERRFRDPLRVVEDRRRTELAIVGVSLLGDEEVDDELQHALLRYTKAFHSEPALREIWSQARAIHERAVANGADWELVHEVPAGWSMLHQPPENGLYRRFAVINRFHDWVLDQLAVGVATSTILERYARGVERFSADELRNALEDAKKGKRGNPDELLASRKMADWLHAQGLDPYNEVQLGKGRADIGVLAGPDQVVVEAKVVRVGDSDRTIRRRLSGGLDQARRYADQLNHVAGYLVVFWLDDATRLDGPREVPIGGGVVRVVIVDLREAPSSMGSARSVRLPKGRP